MTQHGQASPPLVSQSPGLWSRVLRAGAKLAVRVSLVFSPRPTVLLLRKAFAAGGAKTAQRLVAHEPADVAGIVDERYGDDPDMLLDVYRPAAATGALPTVFWVHGGGWIGGSKDELAVYFKLIAGKGFAVVAPRYSLAPEQHYPTPLRELMDALAHIQTSADRLRLDTARVVLGGDSAGAQLAAQLAALVTTPGYAEAVGVEPTITHERLRGVVLACGPYDLGLLQQAATPTGRRIVSAVLWAYSGRRDFGKDTAFALMSVADHLSPAFPPALVTVGNADPLRPHSELLVERLQANGAEPETVFFPPDHAPALGHEYQFDLDSDAGRHFLDRLGSFLERRAQPSTV